MASKTVTLKAKGITKSFTAPVEIALLRGIDLELYEQTSIAIMGRSGEGKSTLLHILGTLENPSQGFLEIAGKEVSTFNKSTIRSRHIGFVFQSFHLLEDFTVLENILMPARIARMATHKGSAAYRKACDLLDHVGLTSHADRFAKLLSGGEKQRVAIARALCNDPDILMADEPSGNLDAHTADAIHRLLLGFAEQKGKSLVVVTHNQDLARLCHERYQLREGRLVLADS